MRQRGRIVLDTQTLKRSGRKWTPYTKQFPVLREEQGFQSLAAGFESLTGSHITEGKIMNEEPKCRTEKQPYTFDDALDKIAALESYISTHST